MRRLTLHSSLNVAAATRNMYLVNVFQDLELMFFMYFVNVFWRTGRRHSIIFQSVGLLTSGFNIHNPAHEDLENRIAETIHQDS
jgi:hypothetical protein